ncbi:hypothetical protein D3C73_813060 [compost metagenome]
MGFYSGASLHQGIQLPDELAGLGAGHLEKLFCSGGQLCRTAALRSLKQLAGRLLGSPEDNSPFVEQLHIPLFKLRDNRLDDYRMLLLLFFPECNLFENTHWQHLPV